MFLSLCLNLCNNCRLHKLLDGDDDDDDDDDDAHGEKPSFQQLITASKSGTPVNMEHGHQVC